MLWPIIRALQNGGKVACEMSQGAAFGGSETVLMNWSKREQFSA
jgi:hypothetical protein